MNAKDLWIDEGGKSLEVDQYKSLVDYILIEDMYKEYPGLADTIRGLWDHYYARSIVFWTSIVSIFLAAILKLVS